MSSEIIFSDLARDISEDKDYFNQYPDRLFRSSNREALLLYLWRDIHNRERQSIAEAGFPDIVSGYNRFISTYDNYLDNTAQHPTLRDVKQNQGYKKAIGGLWKSIRAAPLDRGQRKLLITALNREKTFQYSLHRDNCFRESTLSSADASRWREKSAGSVAATFALLGHTCFDIDPEYAAQTEDAFYWWCCAVQVLDDVVDFEDDLSSNRQNLFRSFLFENLDEFQSYVTTLTNTPFTGEVLKHNTPSTFSRMENLLRNYTSRIPPQPIYRKLAFFADPKNFKLLLNWYYQLSFPNKRTA